MSDRDVTYLEAIRAALREELARDPAVLLLGEDVGDPQGGVFGATRGLAAEFGADRVIQTPISPGAVVGAAIGAALLGQRPVIAMRSLEFVAEAFSQIVEVAARLHWQTAGALYVPIVLRGPVGSGAGAGPWRALRPEAWLAHAPGLKVVWPSTPYDAKGLLKAAIRDNNPVIFLEQQFLYRRLAEPLPADDYTVPIGSAAIRREGRDCTAITYGTLVFHALEAAEQLEAEGISLEVIDLRTLAPLDRETLVASVRRTSRVVIAHEAPRTAGLGAEVAALLAEEAFDWLDAPILRVTAPDAPYPAAPDLESVYLPGPEAIAAAVRRLVRG